MIRTDRWLCPHCDQLLSTKTFKAHKRRYFDALSNSWFTKQSLEPTRHVQSVMEKDNSLSSPESCEEDPPAPFPLSPVTADQVDIDSGILESPLADFSLIQEDANPRVGSLSGANSTSSGDNASNGIKYKDACTCYCILINAYHEGHRNDNGMGFILCFKAPPPIIGTTQWLVSSCVLTPRC